MSANQAVFPIATMVRELGLSEAGFRARRKRPPCQREVPTRSGRRNAVAAGALDPRQLASDLWRVVHACRASGWRVETWPQAHCPIDTLCRSGRCQPSPGRGHDYAAGPGCAAGAGFGGVSLFGGRTRRLEPQDRRLVRSQSLTGGAGDGRAGDGDRPAAAGRRHSSQRPGQPITSLAFGNRCREAGVRPSVSSVGD